MTLLDNHLEQISLSSTAIAELPFPAPKIFTNALLHSHDITALIRDTETHERALFSSAPVDPHTTEPGRGTIHRSKSTGEAFPSGFGLIKRPRYGPTAATLLGGELSDQLRREEGKEVRTPGQVDVEVLLRGAERLCSVYPILGATEKIVSLRSRHGQLTSSIARFESRVSKQSGQLAKMNKGKYAGVNDGNSELDGLNEPQDDYEQTQNTADDLLHEEEEIRELEKKKRTLEERVSSMERDLGGLLR